VPALNFYELGLIESCAEGRGTRGSLAIEELFLREAHWKLHLKRPRYEVDSGFCQVRLILADTLTAMYISIISHDHGIKSKEFLSRAKFAGPLGEADGYARRESNRCRTMLVAKVIHSP
jgi:hypothetical protein